MNIEILYEDKDLMVLNKPAGFAVHSDGKNKKEKTIADWILENYPKLEKVGEPMEIEYKGEQIKISRPGIVHRLDKETSGALIVAKNQKTFLFLKNQFQNHEIKKTYRAFVYGFVTDPKASLATGKKGVVNVPIGRSVNDIRAYTAGRGAKEPIREAVTEYVILKKFSDIDTDDLENKQEHQFTYIEAYPKTGRTHQIRVHMRYINHPIVSDPIYRGKREMALGMDRLALHAYSITFLLQNGEQKTVVSPLPADFEKVIKSLNL